MSSKDEKLAKPRQRQAHTRSRTGCSECRSRRVRCDERRPTCENCAKRYVGCVYPPTKLPLRERRALERAGVPGEVIAWDISSSPEQPELPNTQNLVQQLILSGSEKTLDCVAINMPLKSHELFHYFYQTGEGSDKTMAYITSDPEALRSAVLIAATHFAFNVGSLQPYEQTFYFHKLEMVRLVKTWFAEGRLTFSVAITKQIATLAYTEACRGDFRMAERHLDAIYDLSCHTKEQTATKGNVPHQEISDRYFLLTSTFMYSVSAIFDGLARAAGITKDWPSLSHPKYDRPFFIYNWHMTEAGRSSHALKLKVVSLFNTLFNYSGEKLHNVSVAPILCDLRKVTQYFYDDILKSPTRTLDEIRDQFWQTRTPLLYRILIEGHEESISGHHRSQADQGDREASWVGLLLGAELYLEQVVVLWRPFSKGLYLYTMKIFQRDLIDALQSPEALQYADLLFWESFIALFSIELHEKLGDLEKEPGFRPFFEEVVRRQSRILGLGTWDDARAVLLNVVWPSDFSEDDQVKRIWEAVMVDEAITNQTWYG